ncbi:MAG: hypothetical protein BWK75_05510 [Candidatus Altiarchaeales archaeon A3]|nr:MAG: hypothetical protein BWK75_05510 [Candidatus Altiarchaeales archaeon A3]
MNQNFVKNLIIVEGNSDEEILKEILEKEGFQERKEESKETFIRGNFQFFVFLASKASKGGKSQVFKYLDKTVYGDIGEYKNIIILVDYDNSKKDEGEIKSKINKINSKIKNKKDCQIQVCFAKQEIEAWLLGCFDNIIKDHPDPDKVIKPSETLENYYRKKLNSTYNKIVDGKRIAKRNKLEHFRYSKSFKNFETILENL